MIALLAFVAPAAIPVPQLFAWQRALAGMSAYCAATLVASPVDVVKCRMQCNPDRATMPLVKDMVVKEGPLVFFAGLGPALMMAPAAVVQYTLIDPLREVMPLIAAAVIAGTLDIVIKCPFERLKTQMQGGETSSVASLLRQTWEANGVRGLWAGLGATLARDVPYLVLKWLTYVHSQALVSSLLGSLFASYYSAQAVNLVAGALAGAVAATVVTPMDVVKTRLQIASGEGATARDVGRQLLREGGVTALFRGIGPRLMRIPVYTAITLATFDLVKDLFLYTHVAGLKQEL